MKILGLDTATTGCSAALWCDGEILARRFEEMERGQAERLNPMIGEVMAEAKTEFAALDAVGVTVGPGAFTGLRIGLATARALALAASTEVIGLTTFAALARAVPQQERAGRRLLVAVNGKRRDVFVQYCDPEGGPEGEPGALDPNDAPGALPAGPLLIAGDGAPAFRTALADCVAAGDGAECRIRFSAATAPPDAALVAELAAESRQSAGAGQHRPVRPVYIRPPDARPSRRERRR